MSDPPSPLFGRPPSKKKFKDLNDIKAARGKIEKFTDEELYRQEQDKINQEGIIIKRAQKNC